MNFNKIITGLIIFLFIFLIITTHYNIVEASNLERNRSNSISAEFPSLGLIDFGEVIGIGITQKEMTPESFYITPDRPVKLSVLANPVKHNEFDKYEIEAIYFISINGSNYELVETLSWELEENIDYQFEIIGELEINKISAQPAGQYTGSIVITIEEI